MKVCKYIIFIIFLAVFPTRTATLLGMGGAGRAEFGAFSKPKPKSKTSCTIHRGKFTVSDQIEYRYGVVAGQNVATIKSSSGSSFDVITGFMGGIAAQVAWPKGFVLQPELLYSQKGCIFSESGLRYDIDYAEVPVKLMYRLHMAEVKPFAFVAPYAAYAFRIAESFDFADDAPAYDIGRFDLGIGVGGGFDVWKVQVCFKYSWGFLQVANETFPIRNSVFTAALGFLF